SVLVSPVSGTQLSSDENYTATLDFGDGTTAPATVQLASDGTHLLVFGSHIYTEEGTYTITATVADEAGHTSTATATVVVPDAALEASGQSFTAVAGSPFSGTVASLDDANSYAPASDFTISIAWGDNSSSSGTAQSNGGGSFTISGTHTYAAAGVYTVTVNIT